MKRLTQKVWHGSQSWNYEALWDLGGQKVKIEIKRDAYDFQNNAEASLFEKAKNAWHVVATIPYPKMVCNRVSYVQRDVTAKAFEADEKAMLEEIKMVLA